MKLTLRQLKVLRAIARLTQAPLSGPMLRRVGINLDEPANLVHDIDMFIELQKDFNEMFASRGWVVHDWIDVRAAHRALSLAKAGDFAAADEVLVRAYTVESVRHGLQQMRNRRWFAKRHELALLALADFEAERFHASVPVVLLLIDGLGKDLTGAGFLRQGVRFAKEDSFLEIGPGLTTLLSTMTASRGSTSTDTISVPHRHGIMHGVDLGYGNVLVAAKAWGALLAIGAHASQLEDSRSVPAPPPLKGLRGQLRDLADSAQRTTAFKRAVDEWRPRDPNGVLDSPPEEGTPEQVVEALLAAWRDGRWGPMAACTADSRKQQPGPIAGRLRKVLAERPAGFLLCHVQDEYVGSSSIVARLVWQDGETTDVELRVWYEDEEGLSARGTGRGDWRVLSVWPLEAALLERRAKRGAAAPKEGGDTKPK